MEAISTQHLTKYYGKNRGIVDVSLSIEKGESFGFIGPNGAGKSTTIRTLLGLISPTSGSARIFGDPVAGDCPGLRSGIGYLPSEASFYPGMRVREVLRLSAGLRKMDCRKEAESLCSRLRLDPAAKVGELSFGNRKKVAIVCALQSRAPLLILDEPTGGLDPLMQREFFDIIRERNRTGATVFLSSHILSEVQQHCSRAAVIREGRIIACGSVDELARTSARRVSVTGRFDPGGLEGIRDCTIRDGSADFLYNGDLNALLRRLHEGEIRDLRITEPDLAEVFLHYYEEEDRV